MAESETSSQQSTMPSRAETCFECYVQVRLQQTATIKEGRFRVQCRRCGSCLYACEDHWQEVHCLQCGPAAPHSRKQDAWICRSAPPPHPPPPPPHDKILSCPFFKDSARARPFGYDVLFPHKPWTRDPRPLTLNHAPFQGQRLLTQNCDVCRSFLRAAFAGAGPREARPLKGAAFC